MKTILIPFLILLLMEGGCSRKMNSFPQGNWLRVDRIKINKDSVIHEITAGENIKIWTDHRFMFTGKYKNDTAVMDVYGGGKYSLDKNHYEEAIDFHIAKELVGQKIKMLLELKGDTLVQTYPVNDQWANTIYPYVIEKFVREEQK